MFLCVALMILDGLTNCGFMMWFANLDAMIKRGIWVCVLPSRSHGRDDIEVDLALRLVLLLVYGHGLCLKFSNISALLVLICSLFLVSFGVWFEL